MEPVNSMKARLARLEARLQSLVEGSAARLFPFSATSDDISPNLQAAMLAGVKSRADGQRIAPNLFTLTLHPGHEEAFQKDSSLIESLVKAVQEAGAEEGLLFLSPPDVRVLANGDVPPQQIHVEAKISLEQLDQTTDLEIEPEGNSSSNPVNAFLIVDGTGIFPLNQAVVNIGRRTDNHLVIDDPRVSRVHAQLRAIKGRFVIFDLDSTGGTFVNDQRVIQGILFPGDVISLAGVPLVFGQETAVFGETQKFDALSDEGE
jgi:pSer/pThr/pTyr-binding forkhead associated (FHA) protein